MNAAVTALSSAPTSAAVTPSGWRVGPGPSMRGPNTWATSTSLWEGSTQTTRAGTASTTPSAPVASSDRWVRRQTVHNYATASKKLVICWEDMSTSEPHLLTNALFVWCSSLPAGTGFAFTNVQTSGARWSSSARTCPTCWTAGASVTSTLLMCRMASGSSMSIRTTRGDSTCWKRANTDDMQSGGPFIHLWAPLDVLWTFRYI